MERGISWGLEPFDNERDFLNAIVETPKGSRNKYKFDAQSGLFKLNKVLPAGHTFPFDFGFIPSTVGEDDDPLDVLLILEEPAFPGCLVEARLLGVIQAIQTKDRRTIRNDRFVACANKLKRLCDVRSLKDLDKDLLEQVEHFFVSYNEMEGRKFKPRGLGSAAAAKKLIQAGHKRFKEAE